MDARNELKRLLRHAYHPPERGKKGRRSRERRGERAPEWTIAETQLLGKMTDQEAARRTGRTVRAVARKR